MRKYIPLIERLKSAETVTKETEDLKQWRNFAGAIGFALLVSTTLIQDFLRTLDFNNYFLLARIFICITIITLGSLWIYSGTTELNHLQTWIRTGHFRIKRPIILFLTFIVLAAYLSILVIKSDQVHVFFLLYSGYLVFDIGTWKLRRDEIKLAINRARTFLEKEIEIRSKHNIVHERENDIELANIYVGAMKIIEDFYFKRPQITRIILTFFVVVLLAIISYKLHLDLLSGTPKTYVGIFKIDPSIPNIVVFGYQISIEWLRFMAYCIYILIVIVSESVLARWRNKMRHHLSEFREKLFEMGML